MPDVIGHAVDLVRRTRPGEADAPDFVRQMLTWGAGPRAVQALVLGGKARAALRGNCHLAVDDVRALAHPVLRHRIITNYSARAGHYDADRVIDDLLVAVPAGHAPAAEDDNVRRVLSAEGRSEK